MLPCALRTPHIMEWNGSVRRDSLSVHMNTRFGLIYHIITPPPNMDTDGIETWDMEDSTMIWVVQYCICFIFFFYTYISIILILNNDLLLFVFIGETFK